VAPADGQYYEDFAGAQLDNDDDDESELSDTPDHEAVNEWIDRVVRHGQELDERYHAEVVDAAITLYIDEP
jgi:hypothetical protein